TIIIGINENDVARFRSRLDKLSVLAVGVDFLYRIKNTGCFDQIEGTYGQSGLCYGRAGSMVGGRSAKNLLGSRTQMIYLIIDSRKGSHELEVKIVNRMVIRECGFPAFVRDLSGVYVRAATTRTR